MKKIISVILALTLTLGLAACGGKAPQETTPATEMIPVENPASALEILETVWGAYTEEEKFPVIGGDMGSPVDGAPGNYNIADENISYSLLVPAEQLANVTEAASMIHMMNANSFTCAAFKLTGTTAADFGAAMKDAILNNQWMCGFPDSLHIRAIGDQYVIVAFGVTDAMTPFETHLAEVYPGAEIIASEPIV